MRRCLAKKDTSGFDARNEDLFSHEKDAADVLIRQLSRLCSVTK
jgi:hypothetical protein